MADWVATVLRRAAEPPRLASVVAEPDRLAVAEARPLLVEVEALLRSTTPVYARGIAMLEILLSNGTSSLYMPATPAHLGIQLKRIVAALEGRELFSVREGSQR